MSGDNQSFGKKLSFAEYDNSKIKRIPSHAKKLYMLTKQIQFCTSYSEWIREIQLKE
jgi:hypothetical protein